ncbi:polysaccharide deacetylase family protein [Streptomyces sp. VRA16 Mangrove soil]|uniref:polysaccharide deacetylase family protein n=1 Tax=Streptomyces sp. VRA16 Mangrove soil TaxID=2817434 RepID=UPI001AA000D2|nr:polysaccharide deacetylase family protein [Streptomyces sp. VRA16 Mangrove soil]MBO1332048.1 polysaccharide deacetylase family protein [Streptomyces sp. VRA16 Mangrove soil]
MTNHQTLPGRRSLLRGFTAVGLAALTGCAATDSPGTPETADPSAAPAAGGPPAARPLKPSAYRLSPIAGYGAQRAAPVPLKARHRPILSWDFARGERAMVLTFDDGPDPRYTPDILRTLRRHDVRAMFFVCGEMAVDNKDLLREMADDGHIIGNHTWTHPLLTRMTRAGMRPEIERTSQVVQDTVGEAPAWFRAPYGAWNRAAFRLGADLGMEPLAWTVDTLDWNTPGTGTIVSRVLGGAAPGVIVLNHDAGGNRSQSVAALREYLPALLDDGYRITVPRRRLV